MSSILGNGSVTFGDSTTQSTAYTGPLTGGRGQVFTASGTFTIPTGVTAVKVTVVGGGGNGGGGTNPGGGGGGAAISYLTGLTAGGTLAVTVGGGGGGTSSVASGTQSITTLANITAYGTP